MYEDKYPAFMDNNNKVPRKGWVQLPIKLSSIA